MTALESRTQRSDQVLIGASRLFMPAAALVMGAILSRQLGTEGRGIVATVLVDLEVATVVAGLGLPVVLRTLVSRHGSASAASAWALGRSMATRLVPLSIVVAVGLIALSAVPLADVWIGVAVLFVTAPLIWYRLLVEGLTAGLGDYRLHALIAFVMNGLPLAVIVALFALDRVTVQLACLAYGIGYLGAFVLAWTARPAPASASADVEIDKSEFSQVWSQSWLQQLGEFLNNRLDLLFISVLAVPSVVGVFAVAAAVGRLPGMAVQVATITMASQVRGDQSRAGSRRYLVRFTLLLAVGSGLAGLAASWLIPVVYGEPFAPAVPLMWILLVGTVASAVGRVASVAILIDGSAVPTVAAVVGVVATFVAMAVGWRIAEETGAAIGSTFGFVVSAVIAVRPMFDDELATL